MIELKQDVLEFAFPEVHPEARLKVVCQRTLRIPDDGKTYPLPPGLGRFPLRHVDDYADRVPGDWGVHGGVMMPMYQCEALWLLFTSEYLWDRRTSYPFAIKVGTGKINAVTGREWTGGVHRKPQDYVVAPGQPWLDGYCVAKREIRQFVAMPLGSGYSAEEQLTGEARYGGLQLEVFPMTASAFERRFPVQPPVMGRYRKGNDGPRMCLETTGEMGLAPGGRMRQEIYLDPYDLSDWDLNHHSRCFVHIANSEVWRAATGEHPPHRPPRAKDYTRSGLPWFEYYGEGEVVSGSPMLAKLKSVFQLGKAKREALEDNESLSPKHIVHPRDGLRKDQVREGRF